MPELVLLPCLGVQEFPVLVEIWRSAVDATHHFLSLDDRKQIEEALPSSYLPNLKITVAALDDVVVGFAGITDAKLEMLFVDDSSRKCGAGSALLDYVVRTQRVTSLDVNEHNPQAVAFYVRKGFQVTGRSNQDDGDVVEFQFNI